MQCHDNVYESQDEDRSQDECDIAALELPATPASSESSHVRQSSFTCSTPSTRKRKATKAKDDEKTLQVMSLVEEKLQSLKPDDSFDVFGKHVANKLRSVSKQQNMIAQKLINDVLFEADMESLTRTFKVLDVGQSQSSFRPSNVFRVTAPNPSSPYYSAQQPLESYYQKDSGQQTQINRPNQQNISYETIQQSQSVPPVNQQNQNTGAKWSTSGTENSSLIEYYSNFDVDR